MPSADACSRTFRQPGRRRREAIFPALKKHLREIHFVPGFSIARRFFDTKFGPNYDLQQPLDRSIFEFLMQLDEYYLEKHLLKPETFFGAYSRR